MHNRRRVFDRCADLRVAAAKSTIQQRQPIFVRLHEVRSILRIAKNVRVPELAFHARRCIIRLLISGRGKSGLGDDRFVCDSHRIGRQRGGIDRALDFFVNRHVFERAAVACCATLLVTLAALLFGGVIRVSWSRLVVIRFASGVCFVFLLLFELLP